MFVVLRYVQDVGLPRVSCDELFVFPAVTDCVREVTVLVRLTEVVAPVFEPEAVASVAAAEV